jgi:hypothetical protein
VPRPNWNYIRVDVLLPSNPKVSGLGVASRWLLIELWCYCGLHLSDGFVPDAVWRKMGRSRDRQPLVANGFASRVSGGYQMHDYLEHQRSRAEVEEVSAKRSEAGKRSAEARARAKASVEHSVEHPVEQTLNKLATEAEAEAEAVLLGADVDDQSSDRNARADLTDLIIKELQMATGRIIDRQWAVKTRHYILDGRRPADPAAYIRATIRNDPDPKTRFLPLYPD